MEGLRLAPEAAPGPVNTCQYSSFLWSKKNSSCLHQISECIMTLRYDGRYTENSDCTPTPEEPPTPRPPPNASRWSAGLPGADPPPLRQAFLSLRRRPRPPSLVAHLHGPRQEACRAHPERLGRLGPSSCCARPEVQRRSRRDLRCQRSTVGAGTRPLSSDRQGGQGSEASSEGLTTMPRTSKVGLSQEQQDDFDPSPRSLTLAPRSLQPP